MESNLIVWIASRPAKLNWQDATLIAAGYTVLRVPDVGIAIARVGGDGVAAVVLQSSGDWDDLKRLRQSAAKLPIVVFAEPGASGVRSEAIGFGADACFCEEDGKDALQAALSAAVKKHADVLNQRPNSTPGGRLIALLGAKGGVGTTTTAFNVAAVLAKRGSVIMAELHPSPGTLSSYFRMGRTVWSLSEVLQTASPRSVQACLWSATQTLRVLFGPRSANTALDEETCVPILAALRTLADFSVLDLPSSASPANRVILSISDQMGFLSEREPVCVEAAKRMLGLLEKHLPSSSGLIISQRVALSAPIAIPAIELELGLPILGVIPPASDLCVQSQRASAPLVDLDPESLAAMSMTELAHRLSLTGARYREDPAA